MAPDVVVSELITAAIPTKGNRFERISNFIVNYSKNKLGL
jgi:hypothetical protein